MPIQTFNVGISSMQAVSATHLIASRADGTVAWFDTHACTTTTPMCGPQAIGGFAPSRGATTTSAIEAGDVTYVVAGSNFAAFDAALISRCDVHHICSPLRTLGTPGLITAIIAVAGHVFAANDPRIFDFETHL